MNEKRPVVDECSGDPDGHPGASRDIDDTDTAMSCALCGWAGRFDDVRDVRRHLLPSGVPDHDLTDWKCPKCAQWVLPEDVELCPDCGTKVTRGVGHVFCPERICDECGTKCSSARRRTEGDGRRLCDVCSEMLYGE